MAGELAGRTLKGREWTTLAGSDSLATRTGYVLFREAHWAHVFHVIVWRPSSALWHGDLPYIRPGKKLGELLCWLPKDPSLWRLPSEYVPLAPLVYWLFRRQRLQLCGNNQRLFLMLWHLWPQSLRHLRQPLRQLISRQLRQRRHLRLCGQRHQNRPLHHQPPSLLHRRPRNGFLRMAWSCGRQHPSQQH